VLKFRLFNERGLKGRVLRMFQIDNLSEKEDKTINKKIRELRNQETNRVFGLPAKDTKRKFFIPAENKIMEMREVDEE